MIGNRDDWKDIFVSDLSHFGVFEERKQHIHSLVERVDNGIHFLKEMKTKNTTITQKGLIDEMIEEYEQKRKFLLEK